MKKLTRASLKFREICEAGPQINNLSPIVKATRLLIRGAVRLFGYTLASRALGCLISMMDIVDDRQKAYLPHLIKINKLRLDYLVSLSHGRVKESIRIKVDWANAIILNSSSQSARDAAKLYLHVLAKYGYCARNITIDAEWDHEPLPSKRSLNKFYIYGPNSSSPPNLKFSDHTLVLTKMPVFSVAGYSDVRLFLNSYTFSQLCDVDMLSFADKYNQIYVHCNTSTITPPFIAAKSTAADAIASLQGLGRILYCLLMQYGRFQCVIEGFDFYLSEKGYSGHIVTGLPTDDPLLANQYIWQSLADHDALFNFLCVKEITSKLDVVGSSEFLKLIGMSSDEYLERLVKVRPPGRRLY